MTKFLSLDFYQKHARWVGGVAIFISLLAWISDWTGMVYACPYCRLQRTVIGILGLFLICKAWRHWLWVYIAGVLAFLGAHVAATQHFRGWLKIHKGEFEFYQPFYIDSFLLSGCALFIISALFGLLLIQAAHQQSTAP